MSKIALNIIKTKQMLFIILVFVFLGTLITFVPEFSIRTISTFGEVSVYMKAVSSLHSAFTMTFILLPLYLLFIFTNKSKRTISFEITRYKTIDHFVNRIIFESLIEAFIFETCIFMTIIIVSSPFITLMNHGEVLAISISSFFGFWLISLLVELLNTVLNAKRYAVIGFCFIGLIIEYICFFQYHFSLILYTLLAYDLDKSSTTQTMCILSAFIMLIVLYNLLCETYKRKSIY